MLFFTLANTKSEFIPCDVAYDKYGNMLFRVCYSILVSHADAEDAVQDVFCKYITKQPTFESEEHLKAWLIRVASNRSKDILRSKKIRSTLTLEEADNYEIDEDQSEILKEVFALPIKYREVIVLHHLEGYSVKEIADLLSISESGVKMRLSRGRDMLKEAISE